MAACGADHLGLNKSMRKHLDAMAVKAAAASAEARETLRTRRIEYSSGNEEVRRQPDAERTLVADSG